MTTLGKYSLKDFNDIADNGFTFKLPTDVYDTINYLCIQVGSSTLQSDTYTNTTSKIDSSAKEEEVKMKKKKGNKAMEVSEEEWESIRTFQPTKIEQKMGLDAEIDEIRLYLNKLTDKTFLDIRLKLIDKLDGLHLSDEEFRKISQMLYDISTTNKFYSKIFADLYSEFCTKYGWVKKVFEENSRTLLDNFKNIKYIDSNVDYDGFCEMNKLNEKRRSLATFYLNLALNGFIKSSVIVSLLRDILTSIIGMICKADSKNEVDELTENVAILFNKQMIEDVIEEADDEEEYNVGDATILETIESLANKKAKDCASLSNKAIFKYMDLVEM